MAKKNVNYQRTVQYLNKVFKAINEHFFDNELEPVTVTVQSTVRAYGHVSIAKTWVNADGVMTRELNVAAEYLSRPIEEVVVTMLHEAAHLYNLQHGIKDVSANGYYHNKRFKAFIAHDGIFNMEMQYLSSCLEGASLPTKSRQGILNMRATTTTQ